MNGNLSIKVKVKRTDILKALRDNLAQHKKDYAEAVEGYFLNVQKKLTEFSASAANGKFRSDVFNVNLTVPVDASKSYGEYISMFEQSEDEYLELTQQDYGQIFLDNWSWAVMAKNINTTYSTPR